eukprot:scaffold17961_cov146-Isochrysis_galbana.AAC.3
MRIETVVLRVIEGPERLFEVNSWVLGWILILCEVEGLGSKFETKMPTNSTTTTHYTHPAPAPARSPALLHPLQHCSFCCPVRPAR